jgi:hypothetical protein
MKKLLPLLLLSLFFLTAHSRTCTALTLQTQTMTVNGYTVQLKVPEGMRVDFLAPLDGPRFLTRGPGNELLVGSQGTDIFRLKWPYTDPETLVTLTGRNHSIAYRKNKIFVAETGGLYTAPYSGPLSTPGPNDFSLVTPLPSQTGGHWSRTVIVGPDQQLYIGIGISGNCSDEYLDNSYPFEQRRGGARDRFTACPGSSIITVLSAAANARPAPRRGLPAKQRRPPSPLMPAAPRKASHL